MGLLLYQLRKNILKIEYNIGLSKELVLLINDLQYNPDVHVNILSGW